MSNTTFETAPQRATRTAGLLYLLIAVFGGFSIGYVPSVVFVLGDAAANAQSVLAHQDLLRLGIGADMVTILCEIELTAILFALLKPVDHMLSVMAAFARLAMIVVMGLNLVNYLVVLELVNGASYLTAFTPGQLQALAMLFLNAHEFGVYAWQIFFGVHLLVLGFLVLKSGYLPRLLGAAMMVGSFGYTLQSVEKFVIPGNGLLSVLVIGLLVVVTIAELAFAFWLLIRGLNIERWNARLERF